MRDNISDDADHDPDFEHSTSSVTTTNKRRVTPAAQGVIKMHAFRTLRNALQKSKEALHAHSHNAQHVQYGEYAFLFANAAYVLPQPFRAQCTDIATELLDIFFQVYRYPLQFQQN
ncbi:hypothetical protein BVRB_040630 [Beta vulgaris subsp. vulgaris]|uniref:Uncharacterized protein n=1 Tax=Beta vulgaris subsp. vulgaris TaxID=3555 RepID=A0A0J7YN04_BETVV|nr:hypothetical protein BVRB_040630 [Beta vulgaris subsp. vulgaris]